MKAITRLAAIALSVAGIAGGVAIAQTTLDPKQAADNPDTANYPYSKNSYLKRDGTLSGDEKAAVTESATDTSRTWSSTSTTTTTTANPAPVETAPVAAAPVETVNTTTVADASPPPRADRN